MLVVTTKLAPVILPVTDALLPVITPPTVDAAVCVPVTLELEPVITPPTVDAAVTVPEALTEVPNTLPLKLVALTLPPTVTRFDVLSNVNPDVAPKISPVSLNCTCVLDPAASILPLILPIKFVAVIVPVATTLPAVMLPLKFVFVPITLPIKLVVPCTVALPMCKLA